MPSPNGRVLSSSGPFDVARSVLSPPAVSEARVRVLKPEPDGLDAEAEPWTRPRR